LFPSLLSLSRRSTSRTSQELKDSSTQEVKKNQQLRAEVRIATFLSS
jgi:hypothetical protein